jgi:diphthine methyl ester acylhydrolase
LSTESSHGAGVVSILPVSDTMLLTGSYDNLLRSFDFRNLTKPTCSIDLEGGVWRIVPRPESDSKEFLLCCMQFGAQTISLNEYSPILRKSTAFKPVEENRLVYGGGWKNREMAAVCSFYEKCLYLCKAT